MADPRNKLPKAETDAERELLAGKGKYDTIRGELPAEGDERKRIRATFLRELILSIDNGALEIRGYWIDSELDLEGMVIKPRLSFWSCRFPNSVQLDGATFPAIGFRHCEMSRIYGSFIKCTGNFDLFGTTVHSNVNLLSAEIGGHLDFSWGSFDGIDWVLFLDGSQIGELRLRNVVKADRISLLGVRAGVLYDDFQSWSTGAAESGFHRLDTFQYGTLGTGDQGPSPIDSAGRTKWLKKQFAPDRTLRPQCWDWLARVLANMGHAEESRSILIAKHDEQLKTRSVRGTSAVALRIYGILYGYGFKPMRLLAWVAAAWVGGALVYLAAANANLMRPTDRAVLEDYRTTCAAGWTNCATLSEIYVPFNAFAYSLDLILPISGLQQAKSWSPSTVPSCAKRPDSCPSQLSVRPLGSAISFSPLGVVAAGFALIERLFGWLAGLMLVSVATGLVKRT